MWSRNTDIHVIVVGVFALLLGGGIGRTIVKMSDLDPLLVSVLTGLGSMLVLLPMILTRAFDHKEGRGGYLLVNITHGLILGSIVAVIVFFWRA